MASKITDNSDLVDYDVISRAAISDLETSDSRYNNWDTRHEMAWTKVKSMLNRLLGIEESDLDDTSQLKLATCEYVAYLAYRTSEREEEQDLTRKHYDLYIKEMSEVRLSVNGVVIKPNPQQRTARILLG